MREFASTPPEPPRVIAEYRPPAGWPSAGAIDMQRVVMQYAPGLPRVLDGVTLSIRGGERVGIAGRTGAGKSSLLLALLRLADEGALRGAIAIDGVDALRLGVADLRGAIAVVPQEGTLFAGTLRYNIDPLAVHSDEEVLAALEVAQLRARVLALPGGLGAEVAEEGGNWSVGERQLLCLARAALRRCRIALLDEATSATDAATDALMQAAIRACFAGATVLTIAHRIHTIGDSDRVLVLERGRVAEFDAPVALLARPGSQYRSLVEETERGAARAGGARADALAPLLDQ